MNLIAKMLILSCYFQVVLILVQIDAVVTSVSNRFTVGIFPWQLKKQLGQDDLRGGERKQGKELI